MLRIRPLFVVAASIVACLIALEALADPEWREVAPAPARRSYHAMAYDADRGVTGTARVKIKPVPPGNGTATVTWGCGAMHRKDYACP